MLLRKSRVLSKLKEGQSCGMIKANLSDPRVIEIAGLSGVDAVWLCGEHVLNDLINLENQIRAAQLHNMDAFVRVPKGSYSDYIKPLEGGANGIIVPNVSTAAEAREIVNMTRFYPQGSRAIDGGNRDGAFTAMEINEYISRSNSQQLIVVQIESPEGIKNIEEIAKVEGIDFLFFGPFDYSHKIGNPGMLDLPEVVAARKSVETMATKYGKLLVTTGAVSALDSDLPPHLACIGADVVGLTSYFRTQYYDKVVNPLRIAKA